MEILIFITIFLIILFIIYSYIKNNNFSNYEEIWNQSLKAWDYDTAIEFFTKTSNLYMLWICYLFKRDYHSALVKFLQTKEKSNYNFLINDGYYYLWLCHEKKWDLYEALINYSNYIWYIQRVNDKEKTLNLDISKFEKSLSLLKESMLDKDLEYKID